MLRRKIEKTLLDWKNTPNHKPLILKGCRQCGKTYSVLEFAKKNYAHTVYLNFFENPQFVSVFSGSLEVDNITMLLSALMGQDAVFESSISILWAYAPKLCVPNCRILCWMRFKIAPTRVQL